MNVRENSPDERPAALAQIDRARLVAANISPATGLATDYLNHFNEAIMLLEMAPADRSFLADLLVWRPMSYCEYFAASHFKERELALLCYEAAEPAARRSLEELAGKMNRIVSATQDALRRDLSDRALAILGSEAAGWLKPLVVRGGAAVKGERVRGDEVEAAPQAAVDAVFGR
jgi:hypothetical protein